MDKNILRYQGSKQVMALVGCITLIQAGAILVQAIYLAKAITQMFEGAAWSIVLPSFAFFLIGYIIRHLMQWTKERLSYRFAERTALYYQEQLLDKIFQLGPRAVGRYGSGNLVTLALEGIPKFKKYLELLIPRMLSMGIIPVIIVIYVWTLDVLSAVTLIIVLPILIIFLILIGLVSQHHVDSQMDNYRLLASHFVDSLRGIVTLKYLGRSKEHEESIASVSNKYRIATNRALRYAFLSSFALDFFASLSVAIVAVELGLRLINGQVFLEPALAILILAPEYFSPVRELGNDFHATMDGKDASSEIQTILAEKGMEQEIGLPSTLSWDRQSKLRIEGLAQLAEDERYILREINLEVEGFQKIGIVGSSGAGKSTLIDLLSGFVYPSAGTIQINGEDVQHLAFPAWQQLVTYIPQHPTIIADTVANNIRLYKPETTEEEVLLAIQQVGLAPLVASFPGGLNEQIGQGGRSLSGGEEQRIALARSLLQQRPVMLLDEPTAHLDIETEQEIKEIMLPLFENKLIFFATHRLHWMKEMDHIYVLANGSIVEQGSHEELMQKQGAYADLIHAQQRGMQ